jgi:aryl-alcohol dehydrogenase-like predicted oxidoreductase
MMLSRREWLRVTAGAGAALGLHPRILSALQNQEFITRAVPSTGERLPVIGLGGRWISSRASTEELAGHRAVLNVLANAGGKRVFDTAPSYGGGASEELAGQWAQEDGLTSRIFWATKLNVAGRGDSPADPARARAQVEDSFRYLKVPVIDAIQVHNMGSPSVQLPILQEYKAAGRIRYFGITTTSSGQYDALARVMRQYPLDFIGIDYAIDNRTAEREILPLAQERGVGVLVYLPFSRREMWDRLGNRPVPEWAAEFDARTWGQFMLKFVVANPAVTVTVPGTGNPEHMKDDLGGGVGRVPDAAHVARMVQFVESL